MCHSILSLNRSIRTLHSYDVGTRVPSGHLRLSQVGTTDLVCRHPSAAAEAA